MPHRLILSLTVLAALGTNLSAHALEPRTYVIGNDLFVEVLYDDGTPAIQAKIRVTDSSGAQLAEGVSDDMGKAILAAPPDGKYLIHVDAGSGHRVQMKLNVARDPNMKLPPPPARSGYPWVKVTIGLVLLLAIVIGIWVARSNREEE